MQKHISLFFLILSSLVFSQQKITKTIESDAPYVEINTEGIDNLMVEESDSNQLEMTITDRDGLGFIENFSCDDFNCTLNIKTELKIENPITNKVDMFPFPEPTNVSAVVKVPKNKKVTVLGETIDIQTHGYEGILRILIDKGNVRIDGVKGITEVNFFSGTVYANTYKNALNLRTRKGRITINDKEQKSTYKTKVKDAHLLVVKTIHGNIVLKESS